MNLQVLAATCVILLIVDRSTGSVITDSTDQENAVISDTYGEIKAASLEDSFDREGFIDATKTEDVDREKRQKRSLVKLVAEGIAAMKYLLTGTKTVDTQSRIVAKRGDYRQAWKDFKYVVNPKSIGRAERGEQHRWFFGKAGDKTVFVQEKDPDLKGYPTIEVRDSFYRAPTFKIVYTPTRKMERK